VCHGWLRFFCRLYVTKINCKKKNVISVENELLRETDSVCFLDSVITTDGGVEVDIKNRLITAQAAFTTLKNQFGTPPNSILRIFNSNVK
jgi:hypothetical protein